MNNGFKKLISFNKEISRDFVKHIETTNNLCVYKLGGHYIPQNIYFPKAKSITLINCSQGGITNILHPRILPNVKSINYLSTATRDSTIHTRFLSDTKWIFPDKNYDYYNYMVEAGYGTKNSDLIKRYITNKKMIDGKNGFDISFQLDLNIPGYGIVSGDWWQSQFYEYLVSIQNNESVSNVHIVEDVQMTNTYLDIKQEVEEEKLEKERVLSEISFFNILEK